MYSIVLHLLEKAAVLQDLVCQGSWGAESTLMPPCPLVFLMGRYIPAGAQLAQAMPIQLPPGDWHSVSIQWGSAALPGLTG